MRLTTRAGDCTEKLLLPSTLAPNHAMLNEQDARTTMAVVPGRLLSLPPIHWVRNTEGSSLNPLRQAHGLRAAMMPALQRRAERRGGIP